jgi:RimJ/RimL family protein N-acetyltransferase
MEMSVRLRPVREEDLADYAVWLNDPEVVQYTTVVAGTITPEGEREWFACITSPKHTGRTWAIEAEGRHIGNCALIPHLTQAQASFGIILGDKSAWGKGYGTAALREVLRVAFAEMNLHRVHLTVFPENERGRRCYARCGFREEGYLRESFCKEGRWQDQIPMAILRSEWEAKR